MAVQQLQHAHGTTVVPSDTLYLFQSLGYPYRVSSALFVGVGGSVRVLTEGGDDVVFSSVPDGTFMPVHVVKVFATGTTASSIVAVDLSNLSPYSYLLDAYSGAAAAYSLRQLSSTYTGSAIRVRRSSDNTEQNIGFASNELDVTALTSFCSGTNGFVTTWYDQSGNGRNATQTTAAEQPKIYDSSTGVITENGKPAVQFDGSNDNLLTSGTPFSATENTLIGVSKQSTVTSFYKRLFCIGLYNSGRYLGTIQNQDDMLAIFNNSTFTCFGGTATSQNISIMYNISTTGYLRQNGTQINTVTQSDINVSYGNKNLHLGWDSARGTNESWNGIGQEFIFYPTQQSSNASGIETNINGFYSIY